VDSEKRLRQKWRLELARRRAPPFALTVNSESDLDDDVTVVDETIDRAAGA
jgi:hypothetical protein